MHAHALARGTSTEHASRRAPARSQDEVAAVRTDHHPFASGPAAVLRLQRLVGNGAVTGLVQRYYEPKVGDGKEKYRFSDNDGMAVKEEAAEGGKEVWATQDLMDAANQTLQSAGSAIVLNKGGSGEWPQDNGNKLVEVAPGIRDLKADKSDAPDVARIKAANRSGKKQSKDSEGVKDSTLALWTDCGRASRVVTGGMVAAKYSKGKISASTRKDTDPEVFSSNMFTRVVTPFLEADESTPYLKEGVHYTVDPKDSNHWLLLAPSDAQQARSMYWELGSKGRDLFDRFASINNYANPEVGQTYTIVSESSMPGYKESGFTWNFHWAGVIMKDGGDNLTLEGYAVMAGDEEVAELRKKFKGKRLEKELDKLGDKYAAWLNRSWVCQMYGTKISAQTFHSQHLKSGTHGNRATTMVAGAK